MKFPRVARLHTYPQFAEHASTLPLQLPRQDINPGQIAQAFSQQLSVGKKRIGNRFSILPMEGWDGSTDGKPTELTHRRWRNFGISGAKLIWGGEAVAIRHDGRANPNQLLLTPSNLGDLEDLRNTMITAHQEKFQRTDDFLVGLQLTHSGRYARPNRKTELEPHTVFQMQLPRSKICDDRLTTSHGRRDQTADRAIYRCCRTCLQNRL